MIVVLNGVPRSGKSTIAAEIVDSGAGHWVNIGVDSVMTDTDPELLPGIGLRPGGERPDLEPFVRDGYLALFDDVADRAHAGTSVVMDVGIHDGFSQPLGIYAEMQHRFAGLRVVTVGVHCNLEELRRRRRDTGYPSWDDGEPVLASVQRWQDAVHAGKVYDLEVETSTMTARDCCAVILNRCAALSDGQ